MKFYLGTDDNGKRTLYPYQKDIPAGVDAPEIDIPTDKDGLHAAIQELLGEADKANRQVGILKGMINAVHVEESMSQSEVIENFAAASVAKDPKQEERPLVASLGIDPHRPSWTLDQLNAMFTKRPEGVQDICYAISKLKPNELAYVAFQLVGQITKPIHINITEGGSDG